MKRILILITLLPSLAWAANWAFASKGVKTATLVDLASVSQQGKYVKAWLLWNYEETQITEEYPKVPYRSVKAITYYDCANNLVKEGQSTLYSENNGAGEVVKSYNTKFDPRNMNEVVPDTVGEELLKFVCSRKRRSR